MSSGSSEAPPVEWVTIREAARIIGRSPATVRRLAARGHVRVHRPPGTIARFLVSDLVKFSPAAVLAGAPS